MKIISNNVPRQMIYGYQLTTKEREQFDYLDDIDSHDFFRYRGWTFDPGEFMQAPEDLAPWQGIASDTYFSGTLIRFVDGGESVIVGRYYS